MTLLPAWSSLSGYRQGTFISKELLREKMTKVFQQKSTTSNITWLPGYQYLPNVGI